MNVRKHGWCVHFAGSDCRWYSVILFWGSGSFFILVASRQWPQSRSSEDVKLLKKEEHSSFGVSSEVWFWELLPNMKAMATHSSTLAWRIPGTGEPGGLLSLGSHRVGDDWSDLAAWPIILLKCITNWSVFCSLQPNFDWYNLLNLFLGPSIFHWFSKYLLNAFSETSVETYFSDVSNNSFRSHKLYVVLKIIFPAK